jgi:hypothetical protein
MQAPSDSESAHGSCAKHRDGLVRAKDERQQGERFDVFE